MLNAQEPLALRRIFFRPARMRRWYAATLILFPQMFMLHQRRDPFLLVSKK
jgi:hypothetical protein